MSSFGGSVTLQGPADRIGDQIGRWKLESLLGTGAMAAVYAATDGSTNAALKLLFSRYNDQRVTRARFVREVKIMSAVTHRNAVRVFEQGAAGIELYYVMEMLQGRSLLDVWQADKGTCNPSDLIDWGAQLCDVLHAYHQQGIVHRDVKPPNVFLTDQGDIKLIDFGVARWRSEVAESGDMLTRDGTALGTPSYMAPEQAMGRLDLVDARSDVFSVGALLYSMLSGRRVHEGTSSDEALIMAATHPAETLALVAPNLPIELIKVVDKALSWHRDDRYASAQELREALEQLQGAVTVKSIAAVGDAEIQKAAAVGGDVENDSDTTPVGLLIDMFRQLQKALEGARLYSWSHPEVARRIDVAFSRLVSALVAQQDSITWQVSPASFASSDTMIWSPDPPYDAIPFNLFSSGFRHITLHSGIAVEEFRKFVRLLLMDPKKELAPEDDLATALWDLGLTHVATQMVVTFRVSDDREIQRVFDDAVFAASEEAGELLSQQLRDLKMLADMGGGAVAAGRMANPDAPIVRESLKAGVLSPAFRAQFEQVLGSDKRESLKTAWIFGQAWKESVIESDSERLEAVTQELCARLMMLFDFEGTCLFIERVTRMLEGRELKRRVVEVCWVNSNVSLLASMLCLSACPPVQSETVENLAKLLTLGEASAIEMVLDRIGSLPEAARPIFKPYLAKNLGGTPASVDIFKGPPEVVRFLLEAANLGKVGASVVGPAMSHADPMIRKAAFEVVRRHDAQNGPKWFGHILRDAETSLKIEALRQILEFPTVEISKALTELAQLASFSNAPYTERRLILEALFRCDLAGAEAVSVQILGKVAWESADQTTKTLCLELLGEFGRSKQAYDVIDSVLRSRTTSARVRESAERATIRWKERAQ